MRLHPIARQLAVKLQLFRTEGARQLGTKLPAPPPFDPPAQLDPAAARARRIADSRARILLIGMTGKRLPPRAHKPAYLRARPSVLSARNIQPMQSMQLNSRLGRGSSEGLKLHAQAGQGRLDRQVRQMCEDVANTITCLPSHLNQHRDAVHLYRAMAPQQLQALVQENLQAVDKDEDEEAKCNALIALALPLAGVGEAHQRIPLVKQALQIAGKMGNGCDRDSVQGALATALVGVGSNDQSLVLAIEQALQSICVNPNGLHRANALRAWIPGLVGVRNGRQRVLMLQKAIHVAGHIENELHRASALSALVVALDSVGDERQRIALMDQVQHFAAHISNQFHCASVLTALVPALAGVGDKRYQQRISTIIEKALEATDKTTDEYAKANALRAVFSALVYVSDAHQRIPMIEEALRVAGTIQNGFHRSSALGTCSQALESVCDERQRLALIEKALHTADTIEDQLHQVSAVCGLVPALAGVADGCQRILLRIEQVLQTAGSMQDESARANALCMLAPAFAHITDAPQCLPLLGKALQMAANIQNEFHMAIALVACVAPVAGMKGQTEYVPRVIEWVLQAVGLIDNAYVKASILRAVVPTLACAGEETQDRLLEKIRAELPLVEAQRLRVLAALAYFYHQQIKPPALPQQK
jgi:hypothetical protein